jgi:hypothetical protein
VAPSTQDTALALGTVQGASPPSVLIEKAVLIEAVVLIEKVVPIVDIVLITAVMSNFNN